VDEKKMTKILLKSGVKCWLLFSKENINAVNIEFLISFCLAQPGSDAPIERVFSVINAFWSDEKTDLK
jgi:hypothetical protein